MQREIKREKKKEIEKELLFIEPFFSSPISLSYTIRKWVMYRKEYGRKVCSLVGEKGSCKFIAKVKRREKREKEVDGKLMGNVRFWRPWLLSVQLRNNVITYREREWSCPRVFVDSFIISWLRLYHIVFRKDEQFLKKNDYSCPHFSRETLSTPRFAKECLNKENCSLVVCQNFRKKQTTHFTHWFLCTIGKH